MKKLSILLIAIGLFSFSLSAQSVEEGNISISLGYGFPNLVGSVFNVYESNNNYKATALGPMYFKGEYLLSDKFGVGLNFAYAGNNITYDYQGIDNMGNTATYEDKITRTTWSALARFNWYYLNNDNINAYAGLGAGYRSATWEFTYGDPDLSGAGTTIPTLFPMGFEVTTGIRYMFSDNFGAYAEIGLAKSPIQAGLTLKF